MVCIKKQDGYTLIIVLWTIVILTIIFSYLLDDVMLDSYLIDNYARQIDIKETGLSAYNIAVNTLLNDKTEYDSSLDNWAEPLSGKIKDIEYKIKISDIGSRLNINYDQLELFREFDDWDQNMESSLNGEMIADIFLLTGIFGGNSSYNSYKSKKSSSQNLLIDKLTAYGNYNINLDSPEKMQKLFDFLEISYVYSDDIIAGLKDYREDGNIITDLNELPVLVDGLDQITFQKIKPYLTAEGRININTVDEDILKAIFRVNKLNEETVDFLIAYRKKHEIVDKEDIKDLLNEEEYEKLAPYFTTTSKYFRVEVNAILDGEQIYEIESEVKREYQESDWNLKVISWSENEGFLE